MFICFGGCCGFGKRGFTNRHHQRLAFYGRTAWLDYWQVYYIAVLKLTKSWVVMKYEAFSTLEAKILVIITTIIYLQFNLLPE